MTTKIIPETKVVRCDVCARACETETPRLHGTVLRLQRHAVDHTNAPCADASLVYDLCDECAKAVIEGINAAAVRIQHFVGMRKPEASS